jgi:coenzyme F420-reducing hydrogenase beta subunit
MTTVCELNKCAGCMACIDICPKDCIKIEDDIQYLNAKIDDNKCINCGQCHRVCQRNNPANVREPIAWYQGWADKIIRQNSSSGGISSAIEKAFICSGGVVASCKLIDGDYKFVLARSENELQGFAGSKYVKSNPLGIYKSVKKELQKGQKVLFLGLPCQVSSMKNCIGEELGENLYTIDLICHGTPSIKILRMALKEYGVNIDNCKEILFRHNTRFELDTDVKKVVPSRVGDFYTKAFLNGIDYTENCYSCHYAQGERVSDLTLGDSWGSDIHEEEKDGISLALVQSEKGKELLDMSEVILKNVDLEKAKIPNTQLRHPTTLRPEHDIFFNELNKGRGFKRSVFKCYPKWCFKQELKMKLIKMHLISPGGG